MAYSLPGVILSEQRGAPTPSISAVHRKTVLVGKIAPWVLIRNEVVVRSSTGDLDEFFFGGDGVVSVLAVESKIGFKDYRATTDYVMTSTGIQWTSTGAIPDEGSSYYVTYRKNRISAEYLYFEARNVEEMYNKGGYPSGDIEESLLYGQIAFSLFRISVIGFQPVLPPYTPYNYQQAINLLTNRNVQTVLCPSVDSTVRATLQRHVRERSLAVSKRERMAWHGPAPLTTVDAIKTTAASLATEEFIFCSLTRAKAKYFNFDESLEKEVTISGAGVATLLGLYRDSIDDPSATLLRARIPGFTLFESDYEDYFTEDALIALGTDSVLQIGPYRDDFTIPQIIDELTTDSTNFKTSSIAVVTAKHYITNSVRLAIDSAFTGKKIVDPVAYAADVKLFLIGLFSQFKKIQALSSFKESDIQVSVGVSFDGSEVNPSKVFISYKYYAVYIHKLTEGAYSLLP